MTFKKTFYHQLLQRSLEVPEGIALKFKNEANQWCKLTWSELYRESVNVAFGLQRLGIKTEDRIAVLSSNCVEWEILFYASQMCGAIVAGIEGQAALEQKVEIIKNSRASFFAVGNRAILNSLPKEVLSQFKTIIIFNENETSAKISLPIIAWKDLAAQDRNFEAQGNEESAGIIVYTSGTTGSPKGLRYTQGQILKAGEAILDTLGKRSNQDCLACWLPVANLFQRIINVCALHVGAVTWLVADPLSIMNELRKIRPTIFIGVPRIFEKIYARMNGPAILKPLFSIFLRRMFGGKVQFILSGSAPMPKHILEFFNRAKLPMYEAYGLSENIIPLTMNNPAVFKYGSVGKPLKMNEITINKEGEILVKGPGQSLRYDGNESQSLLDENGFYHTGDLGYFDDEGFLYLTGRISELIKTSGGRKISPLRIETALMGISIIDQVVVVGHGQKYLIGMASLKKGLKFNKQELKAEINRAMNGLAGYERIRGLLILRDKFAVENHQLTANLKIKRQLVEALHADGITHIYKQIDKQESTDLIIEIEASEIKSKGEGKP